MKTIPKIANSSLKRRLQLPVRILEHWYLNGGSNYRYVPWSTGVCLVFGRQTNRWTTKNRFGHPKTYSYLDVPKILWDAQYLFFFGGEATNLPTAEKVARIARIFTIFGSTFSTKFERTQQAKRFQQNSKSKQTSVWRVPLVGSAVRVSLH